MYHKVPGKFRVCDKNVCVTHFFLHMYALSFETIEFSQQNALLRVRVLISKFMMFISTDESP